MPIASLRSRSRLLPRRLALEILEDRTLLSALALSGLESLAKPTLPVVLSAPAAKMVSVSYAVVGGTAVSGKDYTLPAGQLVFNRGESVHDVPLVVLDNPHMGGDQTLQIQLTASAGVTLTTSSLVYTILDDQPLPTVAFHSATGSGAESASTLSVPLTLLSASEQTVSVPYTLSGTATAGTDYRLASGTITFKPGQVSQTLAIPLLNDQQYETASDTLVVLLGTPAHAKLGPVSRFTYTFTDTDDRRPTVAFVTNKAAGPEFNPSTGLQVTLSAVAGVPVTVHYAVTGGTAHSGVDFAASSSSGTLTFAPGVKTLPLPLQILDDSAAGASKTITVQLSGPTGATLGKAAAATYTLTEADPNVSFAQPSSSALETAGPVDLPVVLSEPVATTVTVHYAITGGTAKSGVNYKPLAAGMLTFAPNTTTPQIIKLTPLDDHVSTAGTTVFITLSSPKGATLGQYPTETSTILDADLPVSVQFGQASATVAESAASASVQVNLSAKAGQTITVPYTLGGTAAAGVDYRLAAGTLTFSPGQKSRTLTIPLLNNHVNKPDATLIVTLGTTSAYTLTIHNTNPPPTVAFAQATLTGSEALSDPSLPVVLSAPSGNTVTVAYAVTGGSAHNGTDFDLAAGTLSFAPGVTSLNVPLTILNTNVPRETIQLTLSGPTNATLGKNTTLTYTLTPAGLFGGFDVTGPTVVVKSAAFDATATNITVTGYVADALADVQALQAQLDGGTLTTETLTAGTNTFHFSLPVPAGGGQSLVLKVTDRATNVTKAAVPLLNLSPGTDPGTAGALSTSDGRVTLFGHASPGAAVQLVGANAQTVASTTGVFRFPNIALATGANAFTVQTADTAGNQLTSSTTITRTAGAAQPNAVLVWNQVLLGAIQLDDTPPPLASRAMAMVQAAVLDAVNAIEGTPAYYVKLAAPAGASEPAAVAKAAYTVLSYLYPGQQPTFDAQLATSLGAIANGQAKADGVSVGQAAGAALIHLRANDGWNTFVDYVPGMGPGVWVPTAPSYAEALLPQWANLTPFAMTADSQFRPAGPPALDSQAWTSAYNEVKALGSATGSTRTADQTQIARFWADGGGSYTPPGHWNQIAQSVAEQQGDSLSQDARLFGVLDVALGDAAIVAWDAKYTDNAWRPITAIQNADTAGNPNVQADPTWTPLLITPNFPEYVSGHSTFSAAAAAVLDAFFGNNVSFSTTSATLPGVTRSFAGFDQAAAEAGQSRIYAGIHFQFSNQDGQAAGRALAAYVLNTFAVSPNHQPPLVLFTGPSQPSVVAAGSFTITGQAIDRLSGVTALQVQLDNGLLTSVPLDANGNFSLPVASANLTDGSHVLHFSAADAAGNVSAPIAFAFTLDTTAPAITIATPASAASITGSATLTGTASGTGSPLTMLCYFIDSGTVHSIVLPGADGSFSTPLDFSTLALGAHTLTVKAQDAAGNEATTTVQFTLTTLAPFTLTTVTPANGAVDVGVTSRPKLVFSRPVDPTTLTAADFYATDSTGTKLPATIVPSADDTYAVMFFTNPMPGASTITLVVDGSKIKTPDGAVLDAAGSMGMSAGMPGSELMDSFMTVSVAGQPDTTSYTTLDQSNPTLHAGASITGIVADPGPDLQPMTFDDVRAGPDGVLNTADDIYLHPLAGVTVYVIGQQSQAVTTDAHGRFTLPNVPTGDVKLVLNGTTVTDANSTPLINILGGYYFPEMVMDLTDVKPGLVNTVMGSMGTPEQEAARANNQGVYLPRLPTSILQPVSATQVTHITADAAAAPDLTPDQRQYLSLDVAPNSAIGFDGKPLANVRVGISTVPPSLVNDMLPPGLLQHSFDITIQAPGVAMFTTPAILTMPNTMNDAPGTQVSFLSFDHTTGRLLFEGTMTVSADGKYLRTDPGTGVTHPGWHCDSPPGSSDSSGPGTSAPTTEAQCEQQALDRYSHDVNCKLWEIFKSEFSLDKFSDEAISALIGKVLASLKTGVDALLLYTKLMFGTTEAQQNYFRAIQDCLNTFHPPPVTFLGREDLTSTVPSFVAYGSAGAIVLPPEKDFDTAFPYLNQAAAELRPYALGKSAVPDAVAEDAAKLIVQGWLAIGGAQASSDLASGLSTFEAQGILPEGESPGHPVYYLADITDRTGRLQELRGKTDPNGNLSIFVGAGATLQSVLFYDPATNSIGQSTPNAIAINGVIPRCYLSPIDSSYPDSDKDGLVDMAEQIIGTNPNRYSTAGDGISDFAKVQQGLNPFGTYPVSTGVVANLPLQGEAKAIALQGSVTDSQGQSAYVATGSYGLAIVNASQFEKPALVGQIQLGGDSSDVAVDSKLMVAAVASNAGGLNLVDVSNPMQPKVLRTVDGTVSAVRVQSGIAYAAFGDEVRSYDLLTGEQLQSVSLGGNPVTALAVDGSYLYAMDTGNVLHAVDIGGPIMVMHGSLNMPAGGGKLFVANSIAYVGASVDVGRVTGGFATANVANPDILVLLSGPANTNLGGIALAANGSGLGVLVGPLYGGSARLNVFDVVGLSDPAGTGNFLTRFILPGDPADVAIGEGIAFVADGAAGLQVVNYLPFDNKGKAPTVNITVPATALEGSTISVPANVTDDVQVRNVELLVNGQVVQNAVSFPFHLAAALPTIAASGSASVTIQLQATDTGGNIGLSNVATVQLARDTTPPRLVSIVPSDGATRAEGTQAVRLMFSKPLNAATVNASTVELSGPGGVVAPQQILLRSHNTLVELVYPPLAAGAYHLTLHAAAILDQAGNALGTRDVTSGFTVLNVGIPTNGLVSLWSAEGDATDGFGTNNGTLEGGVTFAPGRVGQAFQFDGTGDVRIPNNPSLSFAPGTPMSIEMWVYRTGTDPIMHMIGKRVDNDSDSQGSNYQLALNNTDGEGLYGTGMDLPLNAWTHLALSYDGSVGRFYVNGRLVRTGNALGNENAADLLIGGSANYAKFVGLIDEVAIYRRALSPAEILDTISAQSPGAPTVARTTPPNSGRASSAPVVRVEFSEPMAAATITAANFTALNAAGTPIAAQSVTLLPNSGDRIVQVAFGTLPAGDYQLVINGGAITDRSGTPLDFAPITSHFTVTTYTTAWINPAGGNWSDPNNWDHGVVPGPTDNVLIDVPGNVTITYDQGNSEIRSLVSDNPLTLVGGTLTVDGIVQVNRTLTLDGGTLARATVRFGSSGQGIILANSFTNQLIGVTVAGDLELAANAAYVAIAGGTTFATAHLSGVNSSIAFAPDQTLTGTILFEGSDGGGRDVTMNGTSGTLTIASSGAIETVAGFAGSADIGAAFWFFGRGGMGLVNQGTIASSVAGNALTVDAALTNAGTVQVTDGAGMAVNNPVANKASMTVSGGTLTLNGAWTNAAGASITATGSTLNLGSGAWSNNGKITATNGTVNLGGTSSAMGSFTVTGSTLNIVGSFTTAQLQGIYSTTQVNLTGTLDNSAATLTLNAATGSWNLNGGTISGGTLAFADGQTLGLLGNFSNQLVGVTVAGDLELATNAAYVAIAGGTTFATAHLSGVNSSIAFAPDQTLTGTILFEGSDGGGRDVTMNGTSGTLTIASSGAIETVAGFAGSADIGAGFFFFGRGAMALVNQGTISTAVAGNTLAVDAALTNAGTVQVTDGAGMAVNNLVANQASMTVSGGTLTLNGAWTNAAGASITATGSTLNLGSGAWSNNGKITATNGTVNLGGTSSAMGSFTVTGSTLNIVGSFTTAQLQGIYSTTQVNLTGTLDNSAATLTLNAATGSWNLNGGTISGGTLAFADGQTLGLLGNFSNQLVGVTVAGDLELATNAAYVAIAGGTTFATAHLSGVNSSIAFAPDQTLTGTILFEGSDGGGRDVTMNGTSGTLTIASSGAIETVAGFAGSADIGAGFFFFGRGAMALVNQGTISTAVAGNTLAVDAALTNAGTLQATNGASLTVNLTQNQGTIDAGAGSTITINGSPVQTAAGTITAEIAGTAANQIGVINVSGAATLAGTLTATFVGGFTPVSGNTFKVLTFASASGTFSTVTAANLPNGLTLTAVYDTTDVTLDVN